MSGGNTTASITLLFSLYLALRWVRDAHVCSTILMQSSCFCAFEYGCHVTRAYRLIKTRLACCTMEQCLAQNSSTGKEWQANIAMESGLPCRHSMLGNVSLHV